MAREDVCKRVEDMLVGFLADRELEIYKVEYKKEGPDWKLRVYLDKPIGAASEYVCIDECEEVNRYLSDKLDEDDFIERAYTLEVSSPGLDKELFKPSHFDRYIGHLVELKTYEPVNGLKKFEAELVARDQDGNVTVNYEGEDITLPAKKISKINLAVVF